LIEGPSSFALTNVVVPVSFDKMDEMESHPSPPAAKARERLAPRRSMALKPIGRLAFKAADKVLAKYGLGEATLIEQWPEIAGERWASTTLPQQLNRRTDTLTLRVSGVAALELMHQETELVSRINAYCGRRLVKRLKLIQGPINRPAAKSRTLRILTEAEEEQVSRRASAISDPQLRAATVSLGRAIRARS
jgi:hypothetical protein